MTYSPKIPIGEESPANQVVQIQTNFAQFAAKFSSLVAGVNYNHTALNNINQGDHEAIILQKQLSDPGVTQDLDVLYCKNAVSALGTQPQLFVQIPQFLPNAIPNTPMQLTYNTVNTSAPIYQSFLAGGYIFYFGSITAVPAIITLSPTPSSIQMTIAQANTMIGGVPMDVEILAIQPNKIAISSNLASGVYRVSWMAIGVA